MRLSQVGELGLLAELEQLGLIAGVEHDAAQLAGGVVVTQDALVEDVHFRLDRMSWRDLGWRAAAVNLSDLAASGADPEGLVVTLAAPAETNRSWASAMGSNWPSATLATMKVPAESRTWASRAAKTGAGTRRP